MAVDNVGMDVAIKFGDSRSNGALPNELLSIIVIGRMPPSRPNR